MPRRLASLPPLGLLLLSGCCGGYSVVRTTVADHAQVRESGDLVRSPESAVLHYSRLGEPTNACGTDEKYLEDLWVQVPSLTPGQAYTLGAPGVTAIYARQQGQETTRAASIAGRVEIKERSGDGLSVGLSVTITLPSGTAVKLDDDYAFHPMTAGAASPREGVAFRGAVFTSCSASL